MWSEGSSAGTLLLTKAGHLEFLLTEKTGDSEQWKALLPISPFSKVQYEWNLIHCIASPPTMTPSRVTRHMRHTLTENTISVQEHSQIMKNCTKE